MKKFLSIILVLAMTLSLAPIGAFAAGTVFSDVTGNEYYAEAALALEKLDIFTGYADGTFGADKSITRSEMAAVVCRMIGKENDARNSKGATKFDDVPADHWASGYINVAAKEEIINGNGSGGFMPDDDVKYEEAIKMVVCGVGLGDDVESDPDDWSAGYIKAAEDNGITDNLKGRKGSASTRGDIAVMVYNGLRTTVAAPVASVEAGTYYVNQLVTLKSDTEGVKIYYTTDGTEPTVDSEEYTGGNINILSTATLKAIAVKDDVLVSDVMSVEYTISRSTGGGGGGGSSGGTTRYNVKFDLNYSGAKNPPATQKVKKNDYAERPDDPEREGYIFTGWYTDEECVYEFDFENTEITERLTLYAGWEEEIEEDGVYTVTFDLNYEGAEDAPESQEILAGNNVTIPKDPERKDYLFGGWYTDRDCENIYDFKLAVNNKLTLYARWVEYDENEFNKAIVQYAYDTLEITYSKGDCKESVTHDLILPTMIETVDISWESNNINVVSESGSVSRPINENKNVRLNASISKGDYNLTKSFEVTVIKESNFNINESPNNSVVDIEQMNKDADFDTYIEYNEEGSQVTAISGKISDIDINSPDDALYAIYGVRTILGMNDPIKELNISVTNSGKYGTDYTFSQQYNGLDVYDRNLTVSVDNNGTSTSLTSDVVASANLVDVNTDPVISESEAINIAKSQYPQESVDVVSTEVVIYSLDEYEQSPVVAYVICLSGDNIDETVIINGYTGSVIYSGSNILDWGDKRVTGSGENEKNTEVSFPVQFKQWDWLFYYMEDSERNIKMYDGGLVNSRVGSEFNVWRDKTAISAYTNMIDVYNWYADTLGRRSVDGNGYPIKVTVHKFGGSSNACWTGGNKEFYFYDNSNNDSNLQTTTASGLDIIAHEYTHGVVQFKTGNGLSHDHSNGHISYAINEAYADIFGWFVDDNNYTIGEDWRPLRNVKDPSSCHKPSKVGGTNWCTNTGNKSVFAHTNSSVISHAAYLMSQGYPSYSLPAISMSKLIDLWYGSLGKGFSANSNFKTVRRNVLLQADTQGLSKAEKMTIKRAFDDVGIYGDRGTLYIQIVDAEDETFIKDATISILDDDFLIGKVQIGAEGAKELSLDVGTYSVVIEKDGYMPFYGLATVTKDNQTEELVKLVKSGEGKISGVITSATTGYPIDGVIVRLRNGWNSSKGEEISSTITNGSGEYSLTASSGYYTIEMEKYGYTTGYFNVTIIGGREVANQNGSISPSMTSNQYRAVLRWNMNPSDLDSHLVGSLSDHRNFHVYFSNRNGYNASGDLVANLDVDDTDGEGPETVTFEVDINSTYEYYVYWFYGEGTWATSGAQVELYNGNNLVEVYKVSSNQSGNSWPVFKISNGILINYHDEESLVSIESLPDKVPIKDISNEFGGKELKNEESVETAFEGDISENKNTGKKDEELNGNDETDGMIAL